MKKNEVIPDGRQGFTLVELLVGMSILILLIMIVIGTLNPNALIGKATDSTRKKDLNKIRTAFEEYFNDHNSYPDYEKVNEWNIKSNCGEKISELSSYLKNWLCDPSGNPYTIVSDGDWFKVVTNLVNKNDKDIPLNWYTDNGILYSVLIDRNEVNYGVSSPNILWYEDTIPSGVCGGKICLKLNSSGCNDAVGIGCSYPDACYIGTCSFKVCKTTSCR